MHGPTTLKYSLIPPFSMLYAHRLVSGACVGAEKNVKLIIWCFPSKKKKVLLIKTRNFFYVVDNASLKNQKYFFSKIWMGHNHDAGLHCKIQNMSEILFHLFWQSIRKDKIAMNNYIIYMETKQKWLIFCPGLTTRIICWHIFL